MNVEDLGDLFGYQLEGLYYVETELPEELAQLADQANVDTIDEISDAEFRDDVREAFSDHREETEAHAARLEDAFEPLGRTPSSREVPALDGLFLEKERFNNIVLNDAARLLFYLDAGMKVEQLEVRCYDSLLQLAAALDLPSDVVDGLEKNRDEDAATLRRLEELSDSPGAEEIRAKLAEDTPEV